MSQTIDDLRRKMIAEGLSSDHAGIATGLAADYAMEAYKQGFSNGFKDGVDWEQKKPSKQPLPGSPFTYELNDIVGTPLGPARICTPPDDHGNCRIGLIPTGDTVCASTFQFTHIIHKHTA